MKILFFTTPEADYLQDSVLHGLRCNFGSEVVDFPQKNILYDNHPKDNIYGKGFTLYNILKDVPVDRKKINDKVKEGFFGLIILGSIHRQQELYFEFEKYLNKQNTIILDGEDSGILFPNHGVYKSRPLRLFKKKLYNNFNYFKEKLMKRLITIAF